MSVTERDREMAEAVIRKLVGPIKIRVAPDNDEAAVVPGDSVIEGIAAALAAARAEGEAKGRSEEREKAEQHQALIFQAMKEYGLDGDALAFLSGLMPVRPTPEDIEWASREMAAEAHAAAIRAEGTDMSGGEYDQARAVQSMLAKLNDHERRAFNNLIALARGPAASAEDSALIERIRGDREGSMGGKSRVTKLSPDDMTRLLALAERGASGDGENDAAPQGAGGGHAGPHDPTKIVPAQETSGTPEAVRPASRRAESVGRGSPAPAATPSPSTEADRLRSVVTGFIETVEAAEAHHEWVRGGERGQRVPFHGDFAFANPAVMKRLLWWVREMRAALAQAAEGEKST